MVRSRLVVIVASLAFAACGSQETATPVQGQCPAGEVANPQTGQCEIAAADEGDDASTGGSSGVDAQDAPERDAAGSAPDVAPDAGRMAPEEFVRFVAIGDTGEGNEKQMEVGQSIGVVCAELGGCDFGLLLGDNFYDSGVSSVDDMMFDTHFVAAYGHLPFPFWAVLGNHDYGGGGIGLDLDSDKAQYQIDYSERNPQWKMPAEHYQFTEGPVWFAALNTTDIFFDKHEDQEENIPQWLAEAPAGKWKIAFGHHPYVSNGPHGNAGEYEDAPFIPIVNGKTVQDFVEDHICGKFDFYLSGHDHSRQDLHSVCGTEFIVSGAGAKTTNLEGDNPVHFEADTEGFVIMEASPDQLGVKFYDATGVLEHSRIVTR